MEKRIAIILARGGSKRLPRKNILPFGGKPLVAWSIGAALESGVFDKVLVSTDDSEIAEIALRYGAEVPFLRDKAADDLSHSSLATHAALVQAESFWSTSFTIVAQLMANCPLRTSGDIQAHMSAFERTGRVSQLSCFEFGWMNPWWAATLDSDGSVKPIFPQALETRSQDLPKLYCPTGALWIANRDSFLQTSNFYMSGYKFEPLDWISAVDIDTEDDLRMAEVCLLMRSG